MCLRDYTIQGMKVTHVVHRRQQNMTGGRTRSYEYEYNLCLCCAIHLGRKFSLPAPYGNQYIFNNGMGAYYNELWTLFFQLGVKLALKFVYVHISVGMGVGVGVGGYVCSLTSIVQ